MDLLIRKTLTSGYTPIIIPEQSVTELIEFGLLTLDKGQAHCFNSGEKEQVGVILGGKCDILGDNFGWKHAGERKDPFRGKATAFYLPPSQDCKITARTSLSLALAAVKTDTNWEPVFIEPDDIDTRELGKGNFYRQSHFIFDTVSHARHLVVGETLTPPGNWCSYPPHRHDRDEPPEESKLEEVCFFKFFPPRGFGYVRIYTGDGELDQVYCVQDGDAVVIPRGYHTIATAPGYQLCCLWALAAKTLDFRMRRDPEHIWVE